MTVEINKIKESVQLLTKTFAAVVEDKLGDRSQMEESFRNLGRQIEKVVSEKLASLRGPVTVQVKTLEHFKGEVPRYETHGASGVDVRACLNEPMTIQPGARVLIPTGLTVAIPEGYEIQARPRSGLAIKKGFTLLNTPGTIDADYRGEIKIIAVNLGQEAIVVNDQERIAQLVVCPVVRARFETVEELDETVRGEGGFGSTGV